MMRLSGVLIVYNEENHIDEVINNISFVDEIIVVDSYSTDTTLQKLKKFPFVKVFQKKFKNFSDQRNFAIEKASGEWILFIDADERIPKDLKNEIINEINKTKTANAYWFKRRYLFAGKIIKFSGLQSDKNYRLFKKGKATYSQNRTVHETLDVQGTSKTLQNYMLHYSFKNFEAYKEKTEFYARLKAEELSIKNKRTTWFKLIIKPFYRFIYNYIIRLGFLDGKIGFIICYLNAYGVWYRYKTLKKITSSKT